MRTLPRPWSVSSWSSRAQRRRSRSCGSSPPLFTRLPFVGARRERSLPRPALQQAAGVRVFGQLCAVADAELLPDLCAAGLDGPLAEAQLLSDLGVGVPECQQPQDGVFPCAKRQVRDHGQTDARIGEPLPRGNRAKCIEQLSLNRFLKHVTTRT